MKIQIAGYEDKIKNYADALDAMNVDWVCTLDPAAIDECDGLLIPGGGDIDPEFFGQTIEGSDEPDRKLDLAQFAILKEYADMHKPVLGICRGHQVINVFFGGDIIQDLSTADIHRQHEGKDSTHETTATEGSWIYDIYGKSLITNSAHHQGLGKLGHGITCVQISNKDKVIEAIEHESLPIYGVQWHPERMCFAHKREDTVDGSRVFEYFLKKVDAYDQDKI